MVDSSEQRERATALRQRTAAVLERSRIIVEQARLVIEVAEEAPWRTAPLPAELRAEVNGLREAMKSRAIIEQAKGIVMATAGCDSDAAFALLREQSQHTNCKLRDVAQELVDRAARHDGERPLTGLR